ncbi:MAG: hypothetical protein IIT59_02830 [Rhodocyclaceae bacterium]|nr:hypothetical protein [Rhodocyclaceae bacterium]
MAVHAAAGAAAICAAPATLSATATRRPPSSHTPPREVARASNPMLPAESTPDPADEPSEQDNAAMDAAE